MEQSDRTPPFRHGMTIAILAFLPLAVHLLVNTFGGYGYFRDELYYLACSKRLAFGYVDHPPFSIYVLAATRLLAGESVFAIRLVPAILSALSVVFICLTVRRMTGDRVAMIIAALAFVASGQLMAFHAFFSMNALDILFWILAAYVVVSIVANGTLRAWLLLGFVLGVGLLNKTSILWLGSGIGVGVLLTGLRAQLRTRAPYLAASIALMLFTPYIVWNLGHDCAHLEFMKNAVALKYSSLTRFRFVVDQIDNMNLPTVLVSALGLFYYLFSREGRRFRVLGIVFLTVFVILLVNPHTKSEYIAAAYPLLFPGGGVLIERMCRRGWWSAVGLTVGLLLVVSGVAVAPLAMPILPVESYIRYAQAIGVRPTTPENKQLAALPQFFADMQGWEDLAREVSRVYLSIPEQERPTTAALVGNYGEAGALEMFARRYPLPRVLCPHNSYWWWGVGERGITNFIRLGGEKNDYAENYGEIRLAGRHVCRYCMPYENNLNVFVARKRRIPIEKAWDEYRHYE